MLKEFINFLFKILVLSLCLLSPTSFANQEIDEEAQEIECLAQNIFFEARGEPHKGKIAVGWVTINRANHKNYPKSICGVVHQRTVYKTNIVYQFSWVANKNKIIKPYKEYDHHLEIAKMLLNGDIIKPPELKEALYFHSTSIDPKWNRTVVARIGRHIFYK